MHLQSPHSSLYPTGATPLLAAWRSVLISCGATAAPGVVLVAVAAAPAAWVTLLVVAPVLEEILFRAGLQELLLRRLKTPHAVANALTALAFAAAHLAVHASVLAALTALPALLIGHVYQQHRRLAPCIALHALFNATWLLWAGAAA